MKKLAGGFAVVVSCVLMFLAGFASGGAAFVDTQARPLPSVHRCLDSRPCLSDPQVLGLLTSAGLHVAPGWLPHVVAQSPECVAVASPRPESQIDYVFFPRRDIADLLAVTPADGDYVLACFALMRQVAEQYHIKNWSVSSHGPDHQEIKYLHFHLLSP